MTTKDHTLKISGGRTGVLLIHGLCGTPAEMRFTAMGLARAGYTVHCPQLAGHGGSRKDIVKTGWKDWLKSAEQSLVELRKECDTVIVGGLCLGSILGIHLAANHPDKVDGVALFSPTFWINGWAMPWYTKLFSLVQSRWVAGFMHFPDAESLGIKCPRVRDFVKTALSSMEGSAAGTEGVPGQMVLEHRRMVKAAKGLLKQITQPALVIHSREDDYAALDNATFVQKELGGEVQMVVLNDSYHMITLDRERHVVVDRTRAFIERLVSGVKVGLAGEPRELLAAA